MNQAKLLDLKKRIKNRDPEIYRMILQESGSYCINQLMRKTNCSVEDAEDVLMDAILIFRDNIVSGKIKELKSIKAYIFSICWNNWRAAHRQKQRLSLAKEKFAASFYAPEQSAEARIVALEDAQKQMKDKEKQAKLSQKALKMLGDKCQKILKYYYKEEKSMAEIATILGYANAKTMKNVKARCYKKWIEFAHQISKETA